MAETTAIEWADSTFNPWVGCTKVSPACDHCYAETWAKRAGNPDLWNGERRRTSESNWQQPRNWNRQAQAAGKRRRVFCASLADVFDNQVPEEWRRDLFKLIRETPWLDWLLLTKRPQNIVKMLPEDWGDGYPNVWLGTTAENQLEADRRVTALLKVPAVVRFLSCEPILGPIDLGWAIGGIFEMAAGFLRRGMFSPGLETLRPLDWIIAGGESGSGARPMHPDWARGLRDQCEAAGVPFLFKQWGEWAPNIGAVDGWDVDDDPEISRFDHLEWRDENKSWSEPFRPAWFDFNDGNYDEQQCVSRIGKKAAGRLLDGRTHDGFPQAAA